MSATFLNLKNALLATAIFLGALASAEFAAAGPFVDTFDSIDPAWVTDRYEPDAFVSESFLGDNRLRIGISTDDSAANRPGGFGSAFYNTQGRQRPAGIGATWVLSGDLYVDSSFNTTTGDLRRTDLWGRDDAIEAVANYPILGITNQSLTDANALDPNAVDRQVRFRAFDSQIGWINLGLPGGFQFDAWHNLEITGTGSTFEYRLDGSLLHTDVTGSLPATEALRAAFVQAYNYGDSSYSVYWDNVAAVPEPATLVLAGLAALGLVGIARRRK